MWRFQATGHPGRRVLALGKRLWKSSLLEEKLVVYFPIGYSLVFLWIHVGMCNSLQLHLLFVSKAHWLVFGMKHAMRNRDAND